MVSRRSAVRRVFSGGNSSFAFSPDEGALLLVEEEEEVVVVVVLGFICLAVIILWCARKDARARRQRTSRWRV